MSAPTYLRMTESGALYREDAAEFLRCASHDDSTRAAHMQPGLGQPSDYDARCGFCWLGHGHTLALHEQTIAEHPIAVKS